jgi:cytochrome c peroxidase
MRRQISSRGGWRSRALIFTSVTAGALAVAAAMPNLSDIADPTGTIGTFDTAGATDTSNPFFQSLGTNGRSCATCHLASDGMGLSSATAQAKFTSTGGLDPLFADIDGANCSGVPRGSAAEHSLMINHGLVRVALAVPDTAEYRVDTVYDPYGCADTIDGVTGARMLSQYRRPLPSTNLQFLSAVMFDGRETVSPLNDADSFKANLVADLTHQALDATLGHAQAAVAPTSQQLSKIVNFELALFSTQTHDKAAGALDTQGAHGGPVRVSAQRFYPGINDSLGSDPGGVPFNPDVFTLFGPWTGLPAGQPTSAAREDVAAGEAIFNRFPLTIRKVGGLNDALNQQTITGTCTTCHDTPNVGNHSFPVPLDIGVGHSVTYENDAAINAALAQLQMPDLPIFKVTCTAVHPAQTIYATDLGKALITGRCADLVRVKGPILRGLAARAPYFHNGAAATLQQVVDFYDQRFDMGLSDEQKHQLEAFLRSL